MVMLPYRLVLGFSGYAISTTKKNIYNIYIFYFYFFVLMRRLSRYSRLQAATPQKCKKTFLVSRMILLISSWLDKLSVARARTQDDIHAHRNIEKNKTTSGSVVLY